MAAPATTLPDLVAVPLAGLVGEEPLRFPIYLETARGVRVLYRDQDTQFDESHVARLRSEGVDHVFVAGADRRSYFHRVEARIDTLLRDRSVPVDSRAEILHGVASEVAAELFTAVPEPACVQRAQRTMAAASSLLVREPKSFAAVRRVLRAGDDLCRHSLTVGFLAMGLAREVHGHDPAVLVSAGLAGLLHDIGRIGHGGGEDDEHGARGARVLRRLGLPEPVVAAALHHHERLDGSGYPQGLRGGALPDIARLIGLVDTFDQIYSAQQPKVGVFDSLRIVGRVYRGCFDDTLGKAFVSLFRG